MKNLTIKARVGAVMTILGLLLIAIGGVGQYGLEAARGAFHETYANRVPGMLTISKFESYSARERLNYDRALMTIGTPDAETSIGMALGFRKIADSQWQQFNALPDLPGESALVDAIKTARETELALLDKGYAAIQANDSASAKAVGDQLPNTFHAIGVADDALLSFQLKASKGEYDSTGTMLSTIRDISIIAVVIGLMISVLSWFSLRRAIGVPLAEALQHFDAMARGDLCRHVVASSRDEMGELMQGLSNMQSSLVDTVRTVRSGSDSIASATEQIAAGNVDLASRTEEQASALQQTASSMDELTSIVQQNADNARQASALAANASSIASAGSEVVAQVVGTMSSINESSSKIGDIIAIIEGISFQTNILALNAAVEAARAGEEGRGFAVVAGEVRTLAQRSAAAAKEIKGLIDVSVDRVQAGTVLVDRAGKTMGDIHAAVQRVTDIMGEIAAASQEQSGGIAQVALAVTQMDQTTQQNAALVEEASAAAQSLKGQAGKLRDAVSIFQIERSHAFKD